MQIGIVGLGRMGANIARRLKAGGHAPHAFDTDAAAVARLAGEGIATASDLPALVAGLSTPRAVWLMLPAGAVTERAIDEVAGLLSPGDVVIDGGNTFWKDDLARAARLKSRELHYLDVGTSGGVWGLERGYCLMIGGEKAVVERLTPIWQALCPGVARADRTPGHRGDPAPAEQGYLHCGPHGAGHFVKMVHNGIEYGVMQALAEGFELMEGAASTALPEGQRLEIDLPGVAEVWRRGSVLTSWLLDLTAASLAEDTRLSQFSGNVSDSGEGRWFLETAINQAVPAPAISAALFARFRSRQEVSFGARLLSAMRKQFGGHIETGR